MKIDLMKNEEYKKFEKGRAESSQRNNIVTMRLYMDWAGRNPTELIDDAEKDFKLNRRNRGATKQRLNDFYTYLTTDYKSNHQKTKGKPLSSATARIRVSTLSVFYSANGFPLGKIEYSKGSLLPKKINKRYEYTPDDIKKCVETATSKRDKAILTFGYQGGFDAKTLSMLDLGDFDDKTLQDLLNDKMPVTPIVLNELEREKSGIRFYTCLGYDSINYLRLYLTERKNRGEKLTLDSPVFALDRIRNGSSGRIKTENIHNVMRQVVMKSGILSKERLDRSDFNIAGFHSLRSTFSRRLEFAGMSPVYIDYMQGHKIAHGGAYRSPHPKKLLEKYAEFEEVLMVSGGHKGFSDIEAKLKTELTEQGYKLKGMRKELDEHKEIIADIMKVLPKLKA